MIFKNKEIVKDKPLVSYCLFTYNQEAYVRASLEAALAQSYSPLEIVVSDDCSSDGTVSVLREVIAAYTGEHRVVLNVNVTNLGIGAHVSKVMMELSSGDYMITVGGDDVSFVDHAECALREIEQEDDVSVVDFSGSIIDGSGQCLQESNALPLAVKYVLDDYLRLKSRLQIFAPGRIVRRRLMDRFGPIASGCPTEDTVIMLRALLFGGLRRVPVRVIHYRRPGDSASSGGGLSRMNNRKIIEQYVADINRARDLGLIDRNVYACLVWRLKVEHVVRSSFYRFTPRTLIYYVHRLFAKVAVFAYQICIYSRYSKCQLSLDGDV